MMLTHSDTQFVLAPTILPLASMQLDYEGVRQMAQWVKEVRPQCLDTSPLFKHCEPMSLFPHGGTACRGGEVRTLTGNELLVELAGRKCYDSFGLKAGKKTNASYIENTQQGDIPHGSIMYHAKMTFFIAGISRRVSHELIRHYVGADRTEEGSPSQESTRFVEHSGRYIVHPKWLGNGPDESLSEKAHHRDMQERFASAMRDNRNEYLAYIRSSFQNYQDNHNGEEPKGMDRKRIYESASAFLSHSAETSFIWTTNPIALAKLIKERQHAASDLEIQRLALAWKKLAVEQWPNLFPQPWMQP